MIKVQAADGSRRNVNGEITLEKGDKVFIDGKLVDAENIIVGDNQMIVVMNGQTVIINNTDIFSENDIDLDAENGIENITPEHTAIIFEEDPENPEQDNIIDKIGNLADLMETAAGDDSVQSHSYSADFAERDDTEVNVEATLRERPRVPERVERNIEEEDSNIYSGSDRIQAQSDLQNIEIEKQLDDIGVNYAKKKDSVSENGGVPELPVEGSQKNNVEDSEEPVEVPEILEVPEEVNNVDNTGGENDLTTDIESTTQDVESTQEQKDDTNEEITPIEEPSSEENINVPENEENKNGEPETEQSEENINIPENEEPQEEQQDITVTIEDIDSDEEDSDDNTETSEDEETVEKTTEGEEDSDDNTEPTNDITDNDDNDILDNQDGTGSGENGQNSNDTEIENTAPEIQEKNILTVNEDNTITFSKSELLENVTDVNENDILDIGNVTTNTGTITEDDGTYTIEVPENYNGTIEVGITATDGHTEVPGKALITVTPINDIPEANFINPTILEDTSVEIDITTSDIEGDNVEVTVFSQPDNGTVSYEDGILSYTPIKDYNGEQEITLKVTDGENIKYEVVQITVSPVNDEPTIEIVNTLEVQEDNQGTITFNISDIDGDNTSFNIQEPEHGTIVVDGTTVNYFPDENYSGTDSITVDYTDGTAQKSSTLNINVTEVNDLPYIEVTNEVYMVEDEVQEILMNTGDIEGTVDVKVQADNGAVIVDEDGDIIYSPDPDFNGIDTIIVTATDEDGVITTKNINVQIDNDNSDIAFEIRTETHSETHTEMVTHTETRDIEVHHTREVEVIDEEANTNAGITYNSEDGKYYRTEEETEVYTETVKEERTRDIQETFTNTRVEQQDIEVQHEREVQDTEAMENNGWTLQDDGSYTKTETETFANTRVEQEEFQDTREVQEEFTNTRDVSETFTNTRIETEEFQNTRTVDGEDTIGTRNTEVIDTDKMIDAGFSQDENGDWVKVTQETFTNTRTETEEYQQEHEREVQDIDAMKEAGWTLQDDGTYTKTVTEYYTDTRIENETFTNTRVEQEEFQDTREVQETFTNTRTETEEFQDTRIIDDPDTIGTRNTEVVNSEVMEESGYSLKDGNWVKETTETFTNTRTETEEFQDTRDMVVEFQDTRTETEEFTNTREVEVEFQDTREVQETFTNTRTETTETFNITYDDGKNANNVNANSTDDALKIANGKNFFHNMFDRFTGNDDVTPDSLVFKNVNNSSFELDNTDDIFVVQKNSNNMELDLNGGNNTVIFENNPGKNVEISADNTENNSNVLVLPGNKADYDIGSLEQEDGTFNGQITGPDNMALSIDNFNGIVFADENIGNVSSVMDITETEVPFEDTRTVQETFTNTRIETEEFQDTREVQVQVTNTRVETEEFTNTRDVTVEFQDTRTVFTQATDDQIIYETEEYVIDDNIYEETFTNTRDVTVEFQDTRTVQEEFTNTRDVTVEFQDTREIQVQFENSRELTITAGEDDIIMSTETYYTTEERESLVEFEDTREIVQEVQDDQIIYETEEYVIDDNIYEETFTDTREVEVEFQDTRTVQEEFQDKRTVQEEFTNTREVEVEFEDTRDITITANEDDIIMTTENFTEIETQDVIVEFQDTRTVQETYEVDVDYTRERLVETDIEVEPITKIENEDYTTTEEEEYTVQEDVEVTNSSNELILDLSGSEININYNLVSEELPEGQEINTINLGENKLENISLDDIMDLAPGEEMTFEGADGSEINFSELPETAQIQNTGEVEKDGEVYNTYSYTDNSIGQELDMMINQNIVTDL